MDFLTKLFGDLAGSFGKDGMMSGLMDMLGSEGMSNLMKGGTALYGGMQAGDMMDFNKSMATKADARQDTLMGNLEEDRARDKNLDFDFNYTS